MARKPQNVTATFPERVKTRVFGRGTRFSLVQEPSVKNHISSSRSSIYDDQFTISHLLVQAQSLCSNHSFSAFMPEECTDKDKCYESGQALTLKVLWARV